MFGVSVGVQRFPIALGALVILACAFVLGRLASGSPLRDGSRAMDAGLWAALALASAPRLVMFARRIFIDIWITAFMSLTLVCFALSERYPDRRKLFLGLMYVSVGLGVLTKGPVAIALPSLSFALYLLVNRELWRVRQMMIPLGIVIVAVIVVPWYAALYHEHGWTYIKSFLISENLERYTSGLGVRQQRGFTFYLPDVLSDSFPCRSLLFAGAAAGVAQRDRTRRCSGAGSRRSSASFRCRRGSRILHLPDRGGRGRPRGPRSRGGRDERWRMGPLDARRRRARCWRWPAPRCCTCSRPPGASTR